MTAKVTNIADRVECPVCHKPTVLEAMPEGYVTKRWPEAIAAGTRKEEPYLRCSKCTCTFPVWGYEEYLARK